MLFPLGDYSAHFLVTGGAEDQLFGVFLSGEYLFETVMVSQDGDNWAGFLVDDVRIEVDITSATDATHHRPPIGSVVKRAKGAFLVALPAGRGVPRRSVELRLDQAEGASEERSGVAFSRWNIVTGEGQSKIVLRTIGAVPEA
jgi:hypothetical protein